MNKLAVGLVIIFISATLATVCPTINYSCSDIGGQCTTMKSCDNCTSMYTSCLGQNSTCYCFSAYVDCLSAAKNPNCPSGTQYDFCMDNYVNCSCGTPYVGAVSEYTCRSNAFCEDSTETCVALKTQGQSCTSDDQCEQDALYAYPFQCVSGVCKQQTTAYAYPNDTCKVDGDCFFYLSEGLGCDTTSKLCKAHAVNQGCTNYGSCGAFAFCNTTVNSCQANYAAGSPCKTTADNNLFTVCGSNMLCGGSNSCVAYYSQDLGASCSVSEECKGEYVCLDKKCSNALPELACDTSADCVNASSNYMGCLCGYCVRDVRQYINCNDNDIAAMNCAQQNGCVEIDGDYNYIPGSCIQNHCNTEFVCKGACYLQYSELANTECLSTDVTCPTPDSASSVAASLAFALVAVFALLF